MSLKEILLSETFIDLVIFFYKQLNHFLIFTSFEYCFCFCKAFNQKFLSLDPSLESTNSEKICRKRKTIILLILLYFVNF